jgi:hypothetical protein
MPTTSPGRTTHTDARRVLALGSALLAAALTMLLAGLAPSASAFTFPSGAGAAGQVQLRGGTLLVADEKEVSLQSGVSVTVPSLASPGVSVTPSPSFAGSQVVKVGYWITTIEDGAVTSMVQVAKKEGVFFWGYSKDFWSNRAEVLGASVDLPQATASRSYKMNLSITWYERTADGLAGEQLAMVWVESDQATENRCEVTMFTCTAAADGLTLSP